MGRTPKGVTEILSFLRNLYVNELYAGVPFHFTPACVLVHFQRTVSQIIYRDPFVFVMPLCNEKIESLNNHPQLSSFRFSECDSIQPYICNVLPVIRHCSNHRKTIHYCIIPEGEQDYRQAVERSGTPVSRAKEGRTPKG